MSSYSYRHNIFIIKNIAVQIFFVGIIGKGAHCTSRDFMKSAIEPGQICIMISIYYNYSAINREAIHVTST